MPEKASSADSHDFKALKEEIQSSRGVDYYFFFSLAQGDISGVFFVVSYFLAFVITQNCLGAGLTR